MKKRQGGTRPQQNVRQSSRNIRPVLPDILQSGGKRYAKCDYSPFEL